MTWPRFEGAASALPHEEQLVIVATADGWHVPPTLLAAIRLAENGGPGREFGILDRGTHTYGEQCRLCAETIANNLTRYTNATKLSPWGPDGTLTEGFLAFLQVRYAPLAAPNDPENLNSNWYRNVSRLYRGSTVTR